MIILGLVVVLTVGLGGCFHQLDKDPALAVPTPAMPKTNARDYYLRAVSAAVTGQKVSLLHQGFQFPYQELPVRSFSTALPQYRSLQGLARTLAADAQARAARGDWNGAMNTGLDAVQIGETMPRGGPLIGMLVGVACQSIGRKQAWRAVDHLSTAQARAAARRLAQIRTYHVPYADTLQEEKWSGQAGFLELMHRPDWSGTLAQSLVPDPNGGQNGGQGGNSPGQWALGTRLRLMGKHRILADYTQTLDRMIADARRPFAARAPVPAASPAADPISDMLAPSFWNTRIRETEANTQNALLMVTLALRAYKMEHGVYPATLAALAPNYLQAVPDDPFALSGALRYKRQGARYILYSVGPDGKDDGGAAIFDRTKPAPTSSDGSDRRRWVEQDSRGDIVAGVNIY